VCGRKCGWISFQNCKAKKSQWYKSKPLNLKFYATFKTEFCYENYLSRLSEFGRKEISKLRTSNCKMPIETGRWQNISKEDRICHMCREGVGDEYHYLFLCKNEAVF
jgi:hypothetical protein